MLFRILSFLVNLIFFFLSRTAWISYLEIWACSDSPVPLCASNCWGIKEQVSVVSFIQILAPLKGLRQLLFYGTPHAQSFSNCFMVVCRVGIIHCRGQGPCFVLHSPSIELWGWRGAGVCHSTNTWLIEWITKGAGFSPWDLSFYYQCRYFGGIRIMDAWIF